jgi:hypothetical protein
VGEDTVRDTVRDTRVWGFCGVPCEEGPLEEGRLLRGTLRGGAVGGWKGRRVLGWPAARTRSKARHWKNTGPGWVAKAENGQVANALETVEVANTIVAGAKVFAPWWEGGQFRAAAAIRQKHFCVTMVRQKHSFIGGLEDERACSQARVRESGVATNYAMTQAALLRHEPLIVVWYCMT